MYSSRNSHAVYSSLSAYNPAPCGTRIVPPTFKSLAPREISISSIDPARKQTLYAYDDYCRQGNCTLTYNVNYVGPVEQPVQEAAKARKFFEK